MTEQQLRGLQPATVRRPRVLLADDHRAFAQTVSTMLADDFHVVGIAADGREALELAAQSHPDAIVLDVDMPRLSGLETLRALGQGELAKIPVVLLSNHGAEEIVGEAFRSGGLGYVMKSRAAFDLMTALDQALTGRRFLPSLTSLFQLEAANVHAMYLHRGPESLLTGLAGFFDTALRRGDAACVIAAAPVRLGLEDRLRSRGWNVGGPSGHPRFLAIDAADALDRVMRHDLPDPGRLAEIVAELDQYRRAVAEGSTGRLTFFADTSATLSAAGERDCALVLERDWGALTRDLPFFTLCGYPTSCFHAGVPTLWSGVAIEHCALSHASDI